MPKRSCFFSQWGILPLTDNHSDDEHHYEVHVYTGFRRNAGTDSKISMIVAGTKSDSGIRKLEDGVRKVGSVPENKRCFIESTRPCITCSFATCGLFTCMFACTEL